MSVETGCDLNRFFAYETIGSDDAWVAQVAQSINITSQFRIDVTNRIREYGEVISSKERENPSSLM